MAVDWIAQDVVSSATPHARARTAYLMSLRAEVETIVRRYLAAHPRAEDVTLEVLESVGRARLSTLGAGRSHGRMKQDAGLFVAQVLVDVYTPSRVFTWRDTTTNAPAGRRNSRASLDWVSKYALHRIEPLGAAERIVLDTVCVRDFIEDDKNGRVVEAMCRAASGHLISIADHAVAELAAALLRDSLKFRKWVVRAPLLDRFLDTQYPVAPGGRDRSASCGLLDGNLAEETNAAYQRAVWRHFRDSKAIKDLERPSYFDGPGEQRFKISLDAARVKTAIDAEGQRWHRFIDRLAVIYRGLTVKPDEQDVANIIRANLGVDLANDQLARLDLPVRVLARRTVQAAAGYKGKNVNDALDLDLLFYVGLPAIVCTRDERLVRLVQDVGARDADRVLTPAQLLARLEESQNSPRS